MVEREFSKLKDNERPGEACEAAFQFLFFASRVTLEKLLNSVCFKGVI